jgi:hypothetical protein
VDFRIARVLFCFVQVLPVFPRLVDLPPDKFQAALARILQVATTFSFRSNSTQNVACRVRKN